MSDQGEPLSWRRTLQEAVLDAFETHGAAVAVGLTTKGIVIRSSDNRVDAMNIGKVEAQEAGDDGEVLYKFIVVAKKSVNTKALPMTILGEADLVVGKDGVILKDRYGTLTGKMATRQLERLVELAKDVVYL